MKSTFSYLTNLSRYPAYLRQIYWRVRAAQIFRAQGVEVEGNVVCYGVPIIQKTRGSEISIGDRVVLCSDSRYTALGVSRPVILRTVRAGAQLKIGCDTGMSGAVICAAKAVIIGRECLFGADVMVFDSDFHPTEAKGRRHKSEHEADARPVEIQDNVFIGARSIVLKGVTIGEGSVIGAASVVNRDIPPFTIAAGNPAQPLKQIPRKLEIFGT